MTGHFAPALLGYSDSLYGKIGFPALFIIGFSYSLYHCVGMCGGFVAAYSATCTAREGTPGAVGAPGRSQWLDAWPMHLLFNLGRVTSYTLIGSVMGAAGSMAAYYSRFSGERLQGIVGVVGGVFMIIFGISLTGLVRAPAGTLLGGKATKNLFGRLLRSRASWRTYPMGMLIGTVPCGLVYSMSSYALATASPIRGALAMMAFGLGTVPAMFCFGFVSTWLGGRVRKGMLGVAVVLTIVMGIEAIRRGLGALG